MSTATVLIQRPVVQSTAKRTEKVAEKVVEKVAEASVPLKREVSRFSQVLLTLSIVSSLIYWTALIHPLSGYLHMGIKWLSISTLTAIVLRFLTCKQDVFLLGALFFHSLGDLFLAHPYQDWLMYSMGPFLLGHIFYILTFRTDVEAWAVLKKNITRMKKILLSASLIYGVIMGAVILPSIMHTPMAVPASIYFVIIIAMVFISVLASYKSYWMMVGCWMYLASDSLIALNKFCLPLPNYLQQLSWPLYYIGQILIAFGFLREKQRSKSYFLFSNDRFSF
eukprot:TRINITY_DN565_c0_g1_i1.p1 TRINITY_DN565_c0_g1~~TRINITY_DN565_c0_g1_i1.p1  ORF type:complete len:280 (+),score=56.30 TRINITY_DN565_c0_g1_i1:100-939(+)